MSEHRPYRILGGRLRLAREQLRESVVEVSGAVEIEADKLEKIEQGLNRPPEEILLLLINHLQFEDDEAMRLWELAGYNNSTNFGLNTDSSKQVTVNLPADTRVLYTDMVHVIVNNYGLVINFLQGTGPNNQTMVVARVGMSKDHARSVLELLQQSLNQAEAQSKSVKALPAPKTKKNRPETT